jgi:outer membrane protein
MKTLKTIGASGLLCLAMVGSVCAQESRIAFINTLRIINESGPAKAATAKLDAEFSKRQKEVNDLETGLKSFSDRFERDTPTLTESQRLARQKEFADQNRDFQRKKRELHEDLTSRRNEELQQVYDKTTKAIKQLAEVEKYDLVVQEAVYFNPKVDITDKVIKLLNAGVK